jgi:diguanylate cyclase (GGDEF)-like protein
MRLLPIPIEYTQHLITQTVSIGASEIEEGDEEVDNLIYRADKALYEAKKRGRNQVVCSAAGSFFSDLAMINE